MKSEVAIIERGLPRSITVDNGPEFASKALDEWAYSQGFQLSFIQPGEPQQNTCIESFNGKFRDECLNEQWFISMRHALQMIEEWRQEYNGEQPHSSLDYSDVKQTGERVFHVSECQMTTPEIQCK